MHAHNAHPGAAAKRELPEVHARTLSDAHLRASAQQLHARSAGTDLIVTFGGGSVTEAGKLVRLCLQHAITDVDGFEPSRIFVDSDGKRTALTYDGPAVGQIAIPTTLSAGEFHAGGGAGDS